jgi:hypothetical protein
MEMNNQPPAPQPSSSGPAGPHGHMDWGGHGMWCNCHGGHHRHFVLRWILGLLILGFVFILGFKLGWLHAHMYGGGYGDYHRGYPMMRYYAPMGGYPMMEDSSVPQSNAPAAPAPLK